MYLFETTKDHLDIARSEIANLISDPVEEYNNLFLANSHEPNLIKRLAYTNYAYQLVERSNLYNLKECIKKISWEKICLPSYGVRSKTDKVNEKELADLIHSCLDEAIVNLYNPETWIVFFEFKDEILICRRIWTNQKSFFKRKTHLRPAPHPSSLDPRLARACINLTGIKKGVLLDPFCGSGGILLEAGNIGLRSVGFDLDEIMLKRARKNLDYFGVTNSVLKNNDATEIKNYSIHIDAIATDLPYGKSSKLHGRKRDELYNNFLNVLSKVKCSRLCVLFPNDYPKEKIERYFSVSQKFEYVLHKSISKSIYVLKHKIIISHNSS